MARLRKFLTNGCKFQAVVNVLSHFAVRPDYVRSTPVLTAEGEGPRADFVNQIPYHVGEATINLMRHRRDAPDGIMDYLSLLYCRAQGFTQFDLGMAPMSGFQPREQASTAERGDPLLTVTTTPD